MRPWPIHAVHASPLVEGKINAMQLLDAGSTMAGMTPSPAATKDLIRVSQKLLFNTQGSACMHHRTFICCDPGLNPAVTFLCVFLHASQRMQRMYGGCHGGGQCNSSSSSLYPLYPLSQPELPAEPHQLTPS